MTLGVDLEIFLTEVGSYGWVITNEAQWQQRAVCAEEVAKLEKHLMLLRQEYVKLQKKLADTERRCNLLAAQANQDNASDTFISRLLAIVAELYQQEQYSDLKIKVRDKRISAHKFVLAARSDAWSLANLASTEELDLSGQFLLSDM
ncbi:UNVERIFIED_CONTAM: hypothetical protein H355_011283 [Colinus virginianus]|nr:hypothetical protein H355_011283 [Colinus virginianus]